jgi:4-amino-4-deoxy-L-arabinose transferase-like glycosyltransferase
MIADIDTYKHQAVRPKNCLALITYAMNSLSLRQFSIVAVLLTCILACLWFLHIGERKLANPDEGRYSMLALHMAQSGDFVTPRLNDLKYFEKPPMQYWATAIALKAFGVSEFSARFYTAICGLLSILLVGYTAGRLFTREIGLFSGLALAACPYFMALAEIITLDMGLTFWMTLSVCGFLLSQAKRTGADAYTREQTVWLFVAWAAMGGAVLSKGLIGILFPATVLFIYCVLHLDWRRLSRMHWVLGLIIFFAITVPWFVMVADRNPEFLRFFFIHEHFERFLTTKHRRTEPWFFFIPLLFAGVMAWALLLVPAIVRGWRFQQLSGALFHPQRFCIIWSAFIVFFFSLSGSKLPAYIAPVFPTLAIVIGAYLAVTPARRIAIYLLPMPPLGAALAWYLHVLPAKRARNPFELTLYRDFADILVPAVALFAALTAVAVILLWRNSKVARRWAVLTIAVASVAMVHRVDVGYEKLSPLQSGYALATAIKARSTPETRIYSVQTYDQTVPFYLQRPVTLVDYVDEFETGLRAEPHKHIAKLADFPVAWNAAGSTIAIVPAQNIAQMRALGLDFEVIHESPRRVALMKR